MQLPDDLETERLTLRKPDEKDAEPVFASIVSDASLTKYLGWEPHDNVEQTRDFLSEAGKKWALGSEYTYLVSEKADAKIVGIILLAVRKCEADFGYVISREKWNRGYATEVVEKILSLLPSYGIRRFTATCDAENAASARVLEKCGMRCERKLPKNSIRPYFSKIEARDDMLYSREMREPLG